MRTRKAIVIANTILIIFMIALPGLAQAKDIRINTYRRNDIFLATFNYVNYHIGTIELGIEIGLLDENTINKYAQLLNNDLIQIETILGGDFKVEKVYLFNDSKSSNAFSINRTVLIPLMKMLDGSYREALIQCASQSVEPWVCHGLAGYVFGESCNKQELASFYQTSEDITILGLFGAYFNETFSSPEEISIVKDTAISFTSYILQNKGLDYLLAKVTSGDKVAWLSSIGVERVYNSDLETRQRKWAFHSEQNFSMIITADHMTYKLNPPTWGNIREPNRIQQFVMQSEIAYENHVKILLACPSYNATLAEPHARRYLSLDETKHGGCVTAISKETSVQALKVAFHEYVHMLIPTSFSLRQVWKVEGIAEYMSKVLVPYSYIAEDLYDLFHLPLDTDYTRLMHQNYVLMGGSYESVENIDLGLYMDAASLTAIKHPEANIGTDGFIQNAYLPIYKVNPKRPFLGQEGSELSYLQSGSFTSFLVDEFGLDEFVSFAQDAEPFENHFPCSYQVAKARWIKSLEMKAGGNGN